MGKREVGHMVVCAECCFPEDSLNSLDQLPLLPAISSCHPCWTGLAGLGRPLAHRPQQAVEMADMLAQSCLPFRGAGCRDMLLAAPSVWTGLEPRTSHVQAPSISCLHHSCLCWAGTSEPRAMPHVTVLSC